MTGEEWDTIVVGAGVLGCATAYHLKRTDPDRSVLLLDRNERPAMGNTRRSVALFRDLFTSATNRDLATSTIAFFDHLEGELGHKLGLRRFGYYWMLGAERLRTLEDSLAALGGKGLDLEVHDEGEVRAMLGDNLAVSPRAPEGRGPMEPVAGAVLARNAGTLSPTSLTRFYEERFRAMGGEVEYGLRVERLVPESLRGGHVRVWEDAHVTAVEGPDGRRRAKGIVVAAGAWTPHLVEPLGIDSHVQPQTRQAFGLVGDGPKGLLERNGFPGGELPVLVLPAAGVYLKPIRSQGMVLAGCADGFGRPYGLEDDPQPEEGFLDGQIRPVLEGYLPGMRRAGVRVSWAGQYHYNTMDGNPFVFRTSNVTVVAGASGSGIMKSDAIGRVATATSLGQGEAELFGGRRIRVSDLGVRDRKVEPEDLMI